MNFEFFYVAVKWALQEHMLRLSVENPLRKGLGGVAHDERVGQSVKARDVMSDCSSGIMMHRRAKKRSEEFYMRTQIEF